MPYLGNPLRDAFSEHSYQDLTGGSGTNFTLDHPVGSESDVAIFVNNVRQEPTVAYNVAGTTLTMTGSISASDDFYAIFIGKAQQTVTHPSGSPLLATSGAFSTTLAVTGVSTLTGGVSIPKAVQGNTLTDTSNTGSVTLDFDTYQNFVLTLTGAVTLANPTTEAVGQSGFIVFIQDGTGSRAVSLGTDYESVGGSGITLSTAANARDIVPYAISATNSILLGAPQLAFS